MFIIIGGDGKEYGPVTADQVRAWIAAGRANLDTKAKALGTEEWRRVGDFVEFSSPAEAPPVVAAPADGTPLADRGSRLGAWFIDNVLGVMCALPGGVLLGAAFMRAILSGHPSIEDIDPARLASGALVLSGMMLALALVQVWMLSTRGQTIGKRLLGIRIARFADGGNPGFVSAVLVRGFLPAIIGLVPYLGIMFTLVDICFIFRDDKRCIHDLMAGTRVVKAGAH